MRPEDTPQAVQAGTDASVPALRLSGVSKAFDDLLANDDVGIELFSARSTLCWVRTEPARAR